MNVVASHHIGVAGPNAVAAKESAWGPAKTQGDVVQNDTGTSGHEPHRQDGREIDSRARPSNVSGSPPAAMYASLAGSTMGTAASDRPGALSE